MSSTSTSRIRSLQVHQRLAPRFLVGTLGVKHPPALSLVYSQNFHGGSVVGNQHQCNNKYRATKALSVCPHKATSHSERSIIALQTLLLLCTMAMKNSHSSPSWQCSRMSLVCGSTAVHLHGIRLRRKRKQLRGFRTNDHRLCLLDS